MQTILTEEEFNHDLDEMISGIIMDSSFNTEFHSGVLRRDAKDTRKLIEDFSYFVKNMCIPTTTSITNASKWHDARADLLNRADIGDKI